MYADKSKSDSGGWEYACGQHCDTASMLATPLRSAHETTVRRGGLQFDRLCRSITQAVKKYVISSYHGPYPPLSAMKKLLEVL